MQLRQLQQQFESDLPKYEEIFPGSADHNNPVQIFVIRSDQQQQQQLQQQQQPYQQNLQQQSHHQYQLHHQQQQLQQHNEQQQQPVELSQLNDPQVSSSAYQYLPQSVMEQNHFVYQQQLSHLQNAPQQKFISCRQQQQQQQQQLPLVHQVQQIAQNQIPIPSPSPSTLP